ncbi:MAG: hypothetical protein GX219_02170 [Tissierellia bacterium]|nr:hypothetical protein [Tissierellia bacterium]
MRKMEKRVKIIVGLVMVLIFAGLATMTGINKAKENAQKELYMKDFNIAMNTLKAAYPYFEVNKDLNEIDFFANRLDFQLFIESTPTIEDYRHNMDAVLSYLNNWNTYMVPYDQPAYFYLKYKDFPADDFRSDIAKIYEDPNIRKRFGLTDEKIETANNIILGKESFSDLDVNAKCHDAVEGKLAYIFLPRMLDMEPERKLLTEDMEKITTYLEAVKDYPALAIDIRGSSGGDVGYVEEFLLPILIDKEYSLDEYSFIKDSPLLEKVRLKEGYEDLTEEKLKGLGFKEETLHYIKDFPYMKKERKLISPAENSINYKGELYLIVDKNVFGAADRLASIIKETGIGTIIGETTAGDSIGTEPMQVILPNTSYVMSFAKQMGVTGDGRISALERTVPDVEMNVRDVRRVTDEKGIDAERDGCIKWIVNEEGLK